MFSQEAHVCVLTQVTSFFAASSRCGTPDDLKYLIDKAHGLGIQVRTIHVPPSPTGVSCLLAELERLVVILCLAGTKRSAYAMKC
jgi:hypothetical protein